MYTVVTPWLARVLGLVQGRLESVVFTGEAVRPGQLDATHQARAHVAAPKNVHRSDEASLPFAVSDSFRLARADPVEDALVQHLNVGGVTGQAGFRIQASQLLFVERRCDELAGEALGLEHPAHGLQSLDVVVDLAVEELGSTGVAARGETDAGEAARLAQRLPQGFFHIRGVETDGDLPLLLLFLQVRDDVAESATLVVGPEVAEVRRENIEALRSSRDHVLHGRAATGGLVVIRGLRPQLDLFDDGVPSRKTK